MVGAGSGPRQNRWARDRAVWSSMGPAAGPQIEGLSVGTYRALIVGAGSMGRAWGQNLRDCENVEVVGWVDLRPDAAAQAAEELGLRGVHTSPDLEKAIAEARPDFVVDVTTPQSHRDVTVQ